MTPFAARTEKPDSPSPSATGRKAGRAPAHHTARSSRVEAKFPASLEAIEKDSSSESKTALFAEGKNAKGCGTTRVSIVQSAERWCRAEHWHSCLKHCCANA